MNNFANDKLINNLASALACITDESQFMSVLLDLCTVSEIKSMSQRLKVAQLLREGLVYSEIAQKTGASSATICRVKRALDYGHGGYDSVICQLGDK